MADKNLQIGDIKVGPGEKWTGFYDVCERPDGTMLRVPLILINGTSDGPTLFMQGAQDGAEVNGVAIVAQIGAEIDPKELSGKLICMPIANVQGFLEKSRRTDIDQMSFRYPGNEKGTFTDQFAAKLYRNIVKLANFGINYHSGGRDLDDIDLAIWKNTGGPKQDQLDGMAKAFGAKINVRYDAPDDEEPSVLMFVAELGSTGVEEQFVNLGVRGGYNVLRYLKMLPGEPQIEQEQYFVNKRERFLANHAGLLRHKVSPGEHVKKGQLLTEITNVFGGIVEQFAAAEDGIVMVRGKYPVVYPGDWAISVAYL